MRMLDTLARGFARGMGQLVGGVLTLGVLIVIIMVIGEYQATKRIEERRAAQSQQSASTVYSVPPSRYDGWGEESLDSSR